MQTWKRLPVQFGPYEISDRGDVRRADTHAAKKPTLGPLGYYVVRLWANGKGTVRYVHRLVAAAFIEEPDEGRDVNHIDGKKTNNDFRNLEYLSRGENMRHAHRTGLCVRGSRAWSAKLDEDLVRSIRARVAAGERQANIAREVGINSGTMSMIINRKTWRHVD